MKIFLFVFLISSSAFATDLSVYLDQQLTMMEKGGAQQLPSAPPSDEFFLRRFWFRIRPKAIFSLPGLVKIQIVPEIEMLWERPLPEGYVAYKR